MSSTVLAPYAYLGEGGDYPIEINFAIRIYDTPEKGEKIPDIGEISYTLKGGLRTNRLGIVPLFNGAKEIIGKAEVLKIIASKPENMSTKLLNSCGFKTIDNAIEYVKAEHGEEFARDGVMTIYIYKVVELHKS